MGPTHGGGSLLRPQHPRVLCWRGWVPPRCLAWRSGVDVLLPLGFKRPPRRSKGKSVDARRAASREDGGEKSRRGKWKWVRVGTSGGVLRLSPLPLESEWWESLGWEFVCCVRKRAPSFEGRPLRKCQSLSDNVSCNCIFWVSNLDTTRNFVVLRRV